jgi:hypothetical protein
MNARDADTATADYMQRQRADIADELGRFNRERERMLGGRPVSSDERLPLPYSGTGGDVAPPGWRG